MAFLGATVGIISIAISAATFTYSNAIKIWREYNFHESVNVEYLRYPGPQMITSDGEMLIFNIGDGAVYISGMVFAGEFGTYRIPIDIDLDKSAISHISLKYRQSSLFGSPNEDPSSQVIENKNGLASDAIRHEALRHDKKCIEPVVISTTHPTYMMMDEFYGQTEGGHIATAPVKAYLELISHRTGQRFRYQIPNIVMMFGANENRSDCNVSDWLKR